jgi:hypothetical protein
VKRYRLYGKGYNSTKGVLWIAQGRQCFYRFDGCVNTPDVIAHKDHDPANWDPENLAASCGHCNAVISNQAKVKARNVITSVREIERGPVDSLIPISTQMQNALDNWLFERLGPGGKYNYLPVVFVEKEASWDCKISPITVHRYLVKPGPMTASNARWRLVLKSLDPRHPDDKTECVSWAGRKLDDELADQLYRTGRQQFVRTLEGQAQTGKN